MFTKALIGLAAAFAVSAASVAPAISASSKVRTARHAQHHSPAKYRSQITSMKYRHSSNSAYDVYVDGQYAGSDPDLTIRSMMSHDAPWFRGGR